MATLSKGYTFGATESVTNTKLHNLVDSGTVTSIVNADIDAGAAIAASKLDLGSSGYLTTGGNFTITGTYTYSTAPVFSVAPSMPTGTIDEITEIASGIRTGSDAFVVTGTKGTTNYTSKWNVDGDLVDGYEVKDEDGMDSDSATALATQQSIKAFVKGGMEVFTSNGTWTRPSGIVTAYVEVVGGGGGGKNGTGSASGSGGGGGGYAYDIADVSEDATVTVTVGAAGSANGGTGGTSSFGAFAVATGGVGGSSGGGGEGALGGAGGAGTSGDLLCVGGDGAPQYNVNPLTHIGGNGGSSRYGGGGSGAARTNSALAGNNYGGGGGGASSDANSGAAGAAGLVIVRW